MSLLTGRSAGEGNFAGIIVSLVGTGEEEEEEEEEEELFERRLQKQWESCFFQYVFQLILQNNIRVKNNYVILFLHTSTHLSYTYPNGRDMYPHFSGYNHRFFKTSL